MLGNYTKCERSRQISVCLYFASKNDFYFYLTCPCPAVVLQLCREQNMVCPYVTYTLRNDGSCRQVSTHLFILQASVVYILHVLAPLPTYLSATVSSHKIGNALGYITYPLRIDTERGSSPVHQFILQASPSSIYILHVLAPYLSATV